MANTTITADQAYDKIMDLSLPVDELKALRDKLTKKIRTMVKAVPRRKTARERFMECVGAWADDPRTTEQRIADIRADFRMNFERYSNV